MEIGITTGVEGKLKHWKLMQFLIDNGFKDIEIHNIATPIRSDDIKELRNLSLNGLSFSIHSATKELFRHENILSTADEYRLKAEIFLAREIGAKNVIFHVPSSVKITNSVVEKLSELVKFSKENSVELVIENNSKPSETPVKELVELLRKTGLKYCIDFGHLNIHTNGDFRKQAEFVRILKEFIVQAHLHGNNKKSDQHKAFDKKRFALIHGLPKGTRLIIEAKSLGAALKSKKALAEFIK